MQDFCQSIAQVDSQFTTFFTPKTVLTGGIYDAQERQIERPN